MPVTVASEDCITKREVIPAHSVSQVNDWSQARRERFVVVCNDDRGRRESQKKSLQHVIGARMKNCW